MDDGPSISQRNRPRGLSVLPSQAPQHFDALPGWYRPSAAKEIRKWVVRRLNTEPGITRDIVLDRFGNEGVAVAVGGLGEDVEGAAGPGHNESCIG